MGGNGSPSSSSTGHQLDALRIHNPEYIRNVAAILTRIWHQRSKRFGNIRGAPAAVGERLDMALAPHAALKPRPRVYCRTAQGMPEESCTGCM